MNKESFVAGMLASFCLGDFLCYIALQGGNWNNKHPRVKIKGLQALTEASQLSCPMSGQISIFYDKATAQKALLNNQIRNTVEIFGVALMGKGLKSFRFSGEGFIGLGRDIILSLPMGYGIVEGANIITNITTGEEDWLKRGGYSIPVLGENQTFEEILVDDYQKPFTEPVDVSSEKELYTLKKTGLFFDEKTGKFIEKNKNLKQRLDDYAQQQSQQYKKENPVHQYRKNKKSKFYSRQKQNLQKQNQRAKAYSQSRRGELSHRYRNRVQKTAAKNFSRLYIGLLGFFAVSEIIVQHLEKTQQKSLKNESHPENRARALVGAFCSER